MPIRRSVLFATTLCLLNSFVVAQSNEGYRVISSIKLGGEGRWDYVVVDNRLLYVTRSTHTQVVDLGAGKVIADIKGGSRLHGTAIVPSANRGFVTDGEAGELIVFDLKSREVLGKVKAADDADGIIYDAGTNLVLVSCGDAGKLLALKPDGDLKAIKCESVDLGGKPEFLAADGEGHAFVCINDKNQIAQVDLKTLQVTANWPTGGGTAPTGLAIDPAKGRLFVGCRNQKLVVMNSKDGSVLKELPIGKGNDACVFDPASQVAFASCGDGTMTAVEAGNTDDEIKVKQTIETPTGARTVTLDPATHNLYLPTADFAAAEQGKRPAPLPESFKIAVVGGPSSKP